MIRNALGSLLGLIGAAAAVWSPFRAWYGSRQGRDYRVEELFSGAGITDDGAPLFGSILLPFLIAALLALVAVVLRSRLLMGLAGVVVLGFAVLWMVRQGQAQDGLSVGGDGQGLGDGLANAFGGGALLLLGAAVMSGRPSRRRRHADAPAGRDEAPNGTPYPPSHQDPRAYPPAHQDPDGSPRETYPPEPTDTRGSTGPADPSGPTGPTGWGPRPPKDQQP
ncbi:hypothetical protein ACFWSF_15275 [Streptomyces sp. NPDC058611]|uniref:hypothetical protein n=1 Tax=unclassified Streptomyces TaxID=2593676 RepID=UPI0036691418